MHRNNNDPDFNAEEYKPNSFKKNNRITKKSAPIVAEQRKANPKNNVISDTIHAESDDLINNFTYQASRYEEGWLMNSLTAFYQNNWISDIQRMIKGGKEASVYLCASHNQQQNEWIAAKVYRPRKFRNLRNDGLYREGRDNLDEHGNIITNAGMLVAMRKKSGFGQQLLHQSWIKHEFNTMKILSSAGCDLPKPLASGANCVLMEYIGDVNTSAPVLQSISLTHKEAKELGQRVLFNVELMLAHQRIHGDLSPYNILFWENTIKMIDFPQAIHPNQNPQAYNIFYRDLNKMDQYFQLFGYSLACDRTAPLLWNKFDYRQAEDYVYDLPDHLDEELLQ